MLGMDKHHRFSWLWINDQFQMRQGARPLSQAGRQAEAEENAAPCESGVADAGLRLASLPPHS
jgi:hypothetical protein